MKEQTIDKIIRKIDFIGQYLQVAFSWYIILFGYGYALRTLFAHYDRSFDKCFYVCFLAIIGFVGQLMLRVSLKELREAKKGNKHE